MTEQEMLVRAIIANPDDEASRLAYIDWLEERGDGRAWWLRFPNTWCEHYVDRALAAWTPVWFQQVARVLSSQLDVQSCKPWGLQVFVAALLQSDYERAWCRFGTWLLGQVKDAFGQYDLELYVRCLDILEKGSVTADDSRFVCSWLQWNPHSLRQVTRVALWSLAVCVVGYPARRQDAIYGYAVWRMELCHQGFEEEIQEGQRAAVCMGKALLDALLGVV